MRGLSVFVLAMASLGCAGPAPPESARGTFSTNAIAAHLARFQPAADTTAAVRRARYAQDVLQRAGVQPVRVGSFLLPHPGSGGAAQSHVVGFLAGRDPNQASELVLVVADLDRPESAAVAEVLRRLGIEAQSAVIPAQTVGVALLAEPRTGRAGMADLVRRPLWAHEGIDRVVLPMVDTTGLAARVAWWQAAGIPAVGLGTTASDDPRPETQRLAATYLLAERLYAHLTKPDSLQ